MNIYISGISGTGMGPLALMAKAAGFSVCGSDLAKGAVYDELIKAGIEVNVGKQDGEFLKRKLQEIDWFVYTSALPDNHPELMIAQEADIKCTKRDDFTAFLVDKLDLKMVAVAGTHGKTTTTAMIVWVALKLGLPVSYIVGTTLGFALSGAYHEGDKYFVYEADEYDRNFLKYHPWLAVIPTVSYDHPDIYPTRESYTEAFDKFKSQSGKVIDKGIFEEQIRLAGTERRKDASLAAAVIMEMAPDISCDMVIQLLNDFPGVGRRFERIADGIYTDYAHHPEEIAATINICKDEAKKTKKNGVIVVYQPHQNTRQHEVRAGYKDAFVGVDKVFWLPTYLTRENSDLAIIKPEEFINDLANPEIAEAADLNDDLKNKLERYAKNNYLVIMMSAGPADEWLRKNFAKY